MCTQIVQERLRFELADDGEGLPVSKLTNGRLSAPLHSVNVGEVFEMGRSTAPKVSLDSGRGVGVIAALEAVERRGGTFTVTTGRDAGTTFRIELPRGERDQVSAGTGP